MPESCSILPNGLKKCVGWKPSDQHRVQFGRQLTDTVFEFYDEGDDPEQIDIGDYTDGEVEGILNIYGYTLGTAMEFRNIRDEYSDNVGFMIAKYIYENDRY